MWVSVLMLMFGRRSERGDVAPKGGVVLFVEIGISIKKSWKWKV